MVVAKPAQQVSRSANHGSPSSCSRRMVMLPGESGRLRALARLPSLKQNGYVFDDCCCCCCCWWWWWWWWLLLVVVGCCCCCIGRGEAANNPIDSSRTRKRLFFGQSVKFCASNFEKLDVRYGKSLSELWSCGRSLSNEGRWIARNVLQRFETDTVYKVKCQQEHALKILRLIYTYFTLAWLRGTLYTKKKSTPGVFYTRRPLHKKSCTVYTKTRSLQIQTKNQKVLRQKHGTPNDLNRM